jgi:O-antigen/teichoic acid export membrane protein
MTHHEVRHGGAGFRGAVENGWGLLDQAVLSGSTLAITIVLARTLSPRDFGLFALGQIVLFMAGTLQATLVGQPHNVLGASLRRNDYRDLTRSLAVAQAALVGALAGACLLVALAAFAFSASTSLLLVGLALALAGTQCLEFARRVLYTEERIPTALACDLIGYGSFIAIAVSAAAAGSIETPAGPLAMLGACCAGGAALGVWSLRDSLAGRLRRPILRRALRLSRWLVAARAGFWLATYLYLYLGAAILGAAAAASVRAAQVLFGPLHVPLLYMEVALLVRLAQARSRGGRRELDDQARHVTLVVGPIIGGYCVAVALAAGPLVDLVYGGKYSDAVSIVRLFAVYYLVSFATQIVTAALTAQERSRPIFFANAMGAALAVTLGWLPIVVFDAAGIVVGMVASIVVVLLATVRAYRREDVPVHAV